VRETPNIEVRAGTTVTEIVGGDTVSGVRVREDASGTEQLLDVSAAFVYVGLEPATELLKDLAILNEDGYVPTDVWMRTARPGLFAAGDIRADSASQAITSAGDGATAAVGAHRYLSGESWPTA
jgi:thioredoxin reductase (NADPH)